MSTKSFNELEKGARLDEWMNEWRLPLSPVVDELAREVAGVEEGKCGVVDVVRVAHWQAAQCVADQHQTVSDWQSDEKLSGRVGMKRRRRDEHKDREEIARDAERNDEQRQRVEVDVEADDADVHRRQISVLAADVACCSW